MKSSCLLLAALMIAFSATACGAAGDDEEGGVESSTDGLTASFVSRGTGYYPDSSALEGGFVDRRGARLRTLQQFLAGQADYVSVAMDANAFSYGQHLRIRELEAKYGRAIDFRVVDTGGAFRGRGRTRIDICVSNRTASVDPTINGTLHIDAVSSAPSSSGGSSSSGSSSGGDPSGSGDPPSASGAAPSGSGDPSGGRACSNDGACNPGNDGSGQICTAGHCVPGCRTNAQCPGSTRCVAGQCG